MKGYNERLSTFDLSREIHEVMHSGAILNQCVLITGMPGAGKSYVAMSLAYNLAVLESIRRYKNAEHWQEFTGIDHIAVIDAENIRKVMANVQPYHIYVLDDVGGGGGYSARKWQSKQNEMMNSIMTTFRTSQAILIMTVQSQSMVDVIARQLFNWYVECGAASAYSYGVSFCRVFRTVLKTRNPASKRVFYHYPRGHQAIYDICACLQPPKILSDAYDKIRKEEAQKLAAKAAELVEDVKNGKTNRTIGERLAQYEQENKRPSRSHRRERAEWNRRAASALGCSLRYIQSR